MEADIPPPELADLPDKEEPAEYCLQECTSDFYSDSITLKVPNMRVPSFPFPSRDKKEYSSPVSYFNDELKWLISPSNTLLSFQGSEISVSGRKYFR